MNNRLSLLRMAASLTCFSALQGCIAHSTGERERRIESSPHRWLLARTDETVVGPRADEGGVLVVRVERTSTCHVRTVVERTEHLTIHRTPSAAALVGDAALVTTGGLLVTSGGGGDYGGAFQAVGVMLAACGAVGAALTFAGASDQTSKRSLTPRETQEREACGRGFVVNQPVRMTAGFGVARSVTDAEGFARFAVPSDARGPAWIEVDGALPTRIVLGVSR